MTAPQEMTKDQMIDDLMHRMVNVEATVLELKSELRASQEIVAQAVAQTVTETIAETLITKAVEAIEAEWSGKFLPELRRTIRDDIQAELHGSDRL